MLTKYRNDLFATRSNMSEALTQANDLYGKAASTADSIAMRTAVHVVLNTAIQQHVIELNAIYDKHAAEVQELRSKLAAKPDPVTALLSLVDERVAEAMEEKMRELLPALESMNDNLDEKIKAWYDDNVDIENAVRETLECDLDINDMVREALENEVDLGDMVKSEVTAYFDNRLFSIGAR